MGSIGSAFALLIVLVLAAGGFALYVLALVNAAKNDKWVWFVLVLTFGPLCVLYWLFAYERAVPPRISEAEPTPDYRSQWRAARRPRMRLAPDQPLAANRDVDHASKVRPAPQSV
jgi:hypothetical protein